MVVKVLFYLAFAISVSFAVDIEDARLSTVELITKYGYPAERHVIQTNDGYLLGLYHVPYGIKCNESVTNKVPILLQHGLLSNAIDFFITGPEKGLGYILADNCFDVWIGNSRGNFESKNHTTLDPKSAEFWNFSWHEMGIYDLPVVIDYILLRSGQPKLHYIGHSQGTTQFYIFASLLEEFQDKVISMHSMAPVAFMENMTSPLVHWIANNYNFLDNFIHLLGLNEFLPESEFVANIAGKYCIESHPNLVKFCENILFALCGFDESQTDPDLLPILSGHDPAGAATKQILHYAQGVLSAQFRQFDYGEKKNQEIYGTAEPPSYPVEKIKIPVYLHYSDNDWMASTLDVNRLAELLPNETLVKVPYPTFNHLDYLWAIDINELLHNKILQLLKQY